MKKGVRILTLHGPFFLLYSKERKGEKKMKKKDDQKVNRKERGAEYFSNVLSVIYL
jgi:hypothetical protein